MTIRLAKHAGSWYSSSKKELNQDLSEWLSQAEIRELGAKAIISPHAGLVYCGATGAYGFKSINPATTTRIIVLGPSHKVYLNGCAISKCDKFETPLYDLVADTEVVSKLHQSGLFTEFPVYQDEDEHSLEMQYPYIAKIMSNYRDNFKIVSVIVGDVTLDHSREYAQVFQPYLNDPGTVFVISSDFCHWGSRFDYSYGANDSVPIWQSITNLDRLGMDEIESLNPERFDQYLRKTRNTICGRRPIMLLLATIELHRKRLPQSKCSFKFLDYSQSSKCFRKSDSSVSYASGVLML